MKIKVRAPKMQSKPEAVSKAYVSAETWARAQEVQELRYTAKELHYTVKVLRRKCKALEHKAIDAERSWRVGREHIGALQQRLEALESSLAIWKCAGLSAVVAFAVALVGIFRAAL